MLYTICSMFQKLKNNSVIKTVADTKNLGLYALAIIALSVTWSSIKIINKNYELEKQIAQLQQQVEVQDQLNKNEKLKNEYYKTDAFLDLASRKYFGKAAPGEKVIVVPRAIAATYVHPEAEPKEITIKVSTAPKFVQNWQGWIDFFLHRGNQD